MSYYFFVFRLFWFRLFGMFNFSIVYKQFKRPILRYVKTKIADESVAEELTQEVFLKAHRFKDSYKKQYAISTWLWTIARNTVSDHLRGFKDWGGGNEPVSLDEIPSPLRDAEEIVIEKDQRRQLRRIMKSLTRLQRRVLWMRLIHQLSYEEISRTLGLSLSAVKNLVYRAKLHSLAHCS